MEHAQYAHGYYDNRYDRDARLSLHALRHGYDIRQIKYPAYDKNDPHYEREQGYDKIRPDKEKRSNYGHDDTRDKEAGFFILFKNVHKNENSRYRYQNYAEDTDKCVDSRPLPYDKNQSEYNTRNSKNDLVAHSVPELFLNGLFLRCILYYLIVRHTLFPPEYSEMKSQINNIFTFVSFQGSHYKKRKYKPVNNHRQESAKSDIIFTKQHVQSKEVLIMNNEKISRKGIFLVMVLGSVITSVVSTIMSTALPVIMKEFTIPASQAQLLTSIYSLVSGIMILAMAFVVKKYPTRNLFFISIFLFTAGVLLCAVAPNFYVMLIGRIIQGVGYGIIISMTQMVILIIIPEGKRGFAMGVYGLAVTFAPVVAPMIAGIIIDNFGWRIIFWIILGMCIIDILLGTRFMKNVLENSEQKFDVPSMVLASVGFTCIILTASNMSAYPFLSLQVGALLIIGVVCLIIFGVRQMKLSTPLLNLRVFSTRDFTVAVIIVSLFYALMNGMSTIVPILVQTVQGHGATEFGIVIAPCALITGLFSPITGKLYDKIGMRPLALIGCTLVFVSNLWILFIGADTPWYALIAPLALLGFGMAFVMMNITTYGMARLVGAEKTDGTALLSCLRTIGGALGTAVFVSIMSIGVQNGNYQMQDVARSYLGMTIIAGIALVIAIVFIKREKPARS